MIIILALIIIIIVFIYSIYIHKKVPEKNVDWWNTFVATLISVLAALLVGLILYKNQINMDTEAKKNQFSKLLKAEISYNYRQLNSGTPMTLNIDTSKYSLYITFVQPLILEQAALSGLFNEVDSENFLHLSAKTRMYNVKVQYLLSLLSVANNTSNYNEQMRHASSNINETRTALLNDYNFISEKLGFQIIWKYIKEN
jgi:hypothetical protein